MNILISFADLKWKKTLDRLNREAEESNFFDKIIMFNDVTIGEEFYKMHGNIMGGRGFGYWSWKSVLVKKMFEGMNDNDILIYLDAGCSVNKRAKDRFKEYIDIVNKSPYGSLAFQMSHLPEKMWNKMDVIDHFRAFDHMDSGQLVGGIFILRKCEHTIKMVDLYFDTVKNHHFITDQPSILENDPIFVEHRHDQSVFSLIRKIHGTEILEDETFYEPDWHIGGKDKPFWATRYKF